RVTIAGVAEPVCDPVAAGVVGPTSTIGGTLAALPDGAAVAPAVPVAVGPPAGVVAGPPPVPAPPLFPPPPPPPAGGAMVAPPSPGWAVGWLPRVGCAGGGALWARTLSGLNVGACVPPKIHSSTLPGWGW